MKNKFFTKKTVFSRYKPQRTKISSLCTSILTNTYTIKVGLLDNCLLKIDMKIVYDQAHKNRFITFFVWKLPQLFVILAWRAGEAYTIRVFVKGSLNMLSWVKKFPTRIYKITFIFAKIKYNERLFLEFLCTRISSNINARIKKNP